MCLSKLVCPSAGVSGPHKSEVIRYDLEPGDEVVWTDTDEGIVVKRRTRTGGRGMLVPDDTPAETREAVAEELRDRVRNRRDRNYR